MCPDCGTVMVPEDVPGRLWDRIDASFGINPGGGCPAYEPAHASVYLHMVRDLGEQERRGQGTR